MVNTVYTVALWGIEGFEVSVECNLDRGLQEISVIGLPDATVKESTDRIRAVATNNNLPFLKGRTTINLAPADMKKTGSYYDLAIFVSMLKHSVLVNIPTDDAVFIGELSLAGELRPVSGALPMCLTAKDSGRKRVFLPEANAEEAAVVRGIEVYGIKNIVQLINHLRETEKITPFQSTVNSAEEVSVELDFADIKGQDRVKRALEVAACGEHNTLLIGPPGSGKSMLSKAFVGILPDMTYDEMIETTKIHSVSGNLTSNMPYVNVRPLRAPHHTLSHVGMVGGGTNPQPGEVSLAHNGVLFLDEFTEFNKKTMEALRQPLEDKKITIARANYKMTYPSKFMLLCAMNPCPCGYYGSQHKECTCSLPTVRKYLDKISGPMLDRIDIHMEVQSLKFDEINTSRPSECSAEVRRRVNRTRAFRTKRLGEMGIDRDSFAANKKGNCFFTYQADEILKNAFDNLSLSARGYDKIVKLARTLADMSESYSVEPVHVLEAIQLRSLDKKYFGTL